MDDRSQKILDNLPQRTSRSCLAPYRELIHELRRRRRTYREIAQVLAERCQCRVSISTLHDFVRIRSRAKQESPRRLPPASNESTTSGTAEKPAQQGEVNLEKQDGSSNDDVQQRIASLKQRPTLAQTIPNAFQFDPDEPLRLPQSAGKNRGSN